MGTRSVFSFVSKGQAFHVYKHWDGCPANAVECIANAVPLSWELNRFEPDEFAASFVAANKKGPGDIRLLPTGRFDDVAPEDIEYRYLIVQFPSSHVQVIGYSVEFREQHYGERHFEAKKIFDIGLKDLCEKVKKGEEIETDE